MNEELLEAMKRMVRSETLTNVQATTLVDHIMTHWKPTLPLAGRVSFVDSIPDHYIRPALGEEETKTNEEEEYVKICEKHWMSYPEGLYCVECNREKHRPKIQLIKDEAARRKAQPVATGVVDYFPDALVAIAELSRIGNEQHNPGAPLHWDRTKSGDESDALMRHFISGGCWILMVCAIQPKSHGVLLLCCRRNLKKRKGKKRRGKESKNMKGGQA